MDPQAGLAYLGLGDVYYYNTKQYGEAINAYSKGVQLRPKSPGALYNLGWCYNDAERYNDAVQVLHVQPGARAVQKSDQCGIEPGLISW